MYDSLYKTDAMISPDYCDLLITVKACEHCVSGTLHSDNTIDWWSLLHKHLWNKGMLDLIIISYKLTTNVSVTY